MIAFLGGINDQCSIVIKSSLETTDFLDSVRNKIRILVRMSVTYQRRGKACWTPKLNVTAYVLCFCVYARKYVRI